ncbi:hypothetical protein IMSAG025_00983 [Muribaculaceae bacterium]|nr:hypothetical protein IMSAG025_00983 [Muribaculaceae bacterium]
MNIWRKIRFVDHKYIALGNAGTVLTGNLVACGNIDHINKEVNQCRTKRKREVVTS